jgi:hypothetical protein
VTRYAHEGRQSHTRVRLADCLRVRNWRTAEDINLEISAMFVTQPVTMFVVIRCSQVGKPLSSTIIVSSLVRVDDLQTLRVINIFVVQRDQCASRDGTVYSLRDARPLDLWNLTKAIAPCPPQRFEPCITTPEQFYRRRRCWISQL